MPVPASINDLSTTAASNSPAGGENPFPDLDNHLRALASFIAQLRDGKLSESDVSAFVLTLFDDADAATARATLGAAGLGANTFTGAQTLPGNATNPLHAMPLQQATGRLIGVRVFTTADSGTNYTPTTGTTSVIVAAVAGGGGGGAAYGTGSGEVSIGGSGSSGAFALGRFTTGFSGALITVGSGGSGAVTNTPGSGATGGVTSLGSLISCPGGIGGETGGNALGGTYVKAGAAAPSAPTGGNLLSMRGESGGMTIVTLANGFAAGAGGSNPFGVGIASTALATAASGSGYGAGASGVVNGQSTAGTNGANGANGVLVIYEYF